VSIASRQLKAAPSAVAMTTPRSAAEADRGASQRSSSGSGSAASKPDAHLM